MINKIRASKSVKTESFKNEPTQISTLEQKIMMRIESNVQLSSQKASTKSFKSSPISKFSTKKNFVKLKSRYEQVQIYLNDESKVQTNLPSERFMKPLSRPKTQSAYLTEMESEYPIKYSEYQLPSPNISSYKNLQTLTTDREKIKQNKTNLLDRKITNPYILEIYTDYEENCKMIEELKTQVETERLQLFQFDEVKLVRQTQSNKGNTLASQQLHLNQRNDMNLEMFRFYYFCFKIRHRSSPLSLFFSQLSQNMKIYVSRFAMYPNRFNAEFQVQSKIFKLHTNDPVPIFQEESLYITIYTDKDTSLNKKYPGQTPSSYIATLIFRFNSSQLLQEQSELLPVKPSDIIKRNLDVTPFQLSIKSQMQLIRANHIRYKSMHIQQKKKIQDEDKKDNVLSKLLAVDQLKSVRRFQEYQSNAHLSKLNQDQNWVLLIQMTNFIQNIKTYLKVVKQRKKSLATGRLYALKHYANMMFRLKKTGDTQIQRVLFNVIMSSRVFYNIVNKKTKQRVILIISSFLEETALYTLMLTKHAKTIKKIIQIQQKFRNLKRQRKYYRETIQKMFQHNMIETLRALKEYQLGILHSPMDKHKQLDQHRKLFGSEFVLDNQLMNLVIDQFIVVKKDLWMEYLRRTLFQEDNKQKTLDLALYLKQPKQYEIPNIEEINQLIKTYGISKKMI